jgi:hypothetical protein
MLTAGDVQVTQALRARAERDDDDLEFRTA